MNNEEVVKWSHFIRSSFSDLSLSVYIIAVIPVVAIGTLEFQCFNITLYRQVLFFCSLLHCQENYSNLKEKNIPHLLPTESAVLE